MDTAKASECPDVKNYKWRLNPVWYRMLYSCIHMATVGVDVHTQWANKLTVLCGLLSVTWWVRHAVLLFTVVAFSFVKWSVEKAPLDPPSPETPPYNQTWSGSDDRLWDMAIWNFSKFRGIPLGADPSCWGCEERTSHAN